MLRTADKTLFIMRGGPLCGVDLYEFSTIRPHGAAKDAIAFWMYRDRKKGTVVQVRYVDGKVVGQWTENPSNRFSVLSFPGEAPGLWSAVDDAIVRRTVTGEVAETHGAPGVGGYRYLYGASLPDRRRLFLASGGGDKWGSMICVFDRDGRLEYQQTLAGRSWALLSLPDAWTTIRGTSRIAHARFPTVCRATHLALRAVGIPPTRDIDPLT